MIRRVFLVLAVATLTIQPSYPQDRTAGSVRQVKAGEVVLFGDSFTVKVSQAAKSPFAGVKVKGEPVVVVLELDGGKKGVTLSYNLTADSRSSDLCLVSGGQKTAPRAVMEDFPSWGSDNDKEIEVLDPKETAGSVSLSFEGKGAVSLLFDVPAAQAKAPRKFSVSLRTLQPRDEAHSFVVNL
ncbi:MAG TPA: hypothetical protein VNS63_27990 [Blastocatellia bacterium]|nr:hypothetical protein [Blastocatellia bacterium]